MAKIIVYSDYTENLRNIRKVLDGLYDVIPIAAKDKFFMLASKEPLADLIILDTFNMHYSESARLVNKLQRNKITESIPIVLFDTFNAEMDIASFSMFHISGFLHQPLVEEELKQIISRVVSEEKIVKKQIIKKNFEFISGDDLRWINLLTNLAETREVESTQHLVRLQSIVDILATIIYQEDNSVISQEEMMMLPLASTMHDIGKLNVAQSILTKTQKLTYEEFSEIKRHTTIGRDIINQIAATIGESDFLDMAAQIALNHHERWDGRGYPRALYGERIPLHARIVSVADVYDAITSRRIYRGPMTHDQALQIMREGNGTLFDPQVMKSFFAAENIIRGYTIKHSDDDELSD